MYVPTHTIPIGYQFSGLGVDKADPLTGKSSSILDHESLIIPFALLELAQLLDPHATAV